MQQILPIQTVVEYLRNINNVSVGFDARWGEFCSQIFILYLMEDKENNVLETCHITTDFLSINSINAERIIMNDYFVCKTQEEVEKKLQLLLSKHKLIQELVDNVE